MQVLTVTPFAASFVSLMFDSGPFAKFLLLVLFVLSVLTWAIIYDRARLYVALVKRGRRLQALLASDGLSTSMEAVRQSMPSIEGGLIIEARRYLEQCSKAGERPSLKSLKYLLDGRAMSEISEMEKYLIFLSTTASVSPFLGLLGTVWGIMSSFLSMGVEGSASIEVVGPGIAEALVTTIAGLGAAITALVGYNLLVRHVRRTESRIELFVSRILALASDRLGEPAAAPRRSEASYEEKSV